MAWVRCQILGWLQTWAESDPQTCHGRRAERSAHLEVNFSGTSALLPRTELSADGESVQSRDSCACVTRCPYSGKKLVMGICFLSVTHNCCFSETRWDNVLACVPRDGPRRDPKVLGLSGASGLSENLRDRDPPTQKGVRLQTCPR